MYNIIHKYSTGIYKIGHRRYIEKITNMIYLKIIIFNRSSISGHTTVNKQPQAS